MKMKVKEREREKVNCHTKKEKVRERERERWKKVIFCCCWFLNYDRETAREREQEIFKERRRGLGEGDDWWCIVSCGLDRDGRYHLYSIYLQIGH